MELISIIYTITVVLFICIGLYITGSFKSNTLEDLLL